MPSLSFHAKAVAFTLLILCGIAGLSLLGQPRTLLVDPAPMLAIEHAGPLTLSVSFSMEHTQRSIDIDQESDEEAYLSVPASWQRTEVRRAPLASIRSEEPAMGFVRWTLPPHAGLSFRINGTWKQLNVRNAAATPLKVRITRVDLDRNTASHDVLLIQEQPVTIP